MKYFVAKLGNEPTIPTRETSSNLPFLYFRKYALQDKEAYINISQGQILDAASLKQNTEIMEDIWKFQYNMTKTDWYWHPDKYTDTELAKEVSISINECLPKRDGTKYNRIEINKIYKGWAEYERYKQTYGVDDVIDEAGQLALVASTYWGKHYLQADFALKPDSPQKRFSRLDIYCMYPPNSPTLKIFKSIYNKDGTCCKLYFNPAESFEEAKEAEKKKWGIWSANSLKDYSTLTTEYAIFEYFPTQSDSEVKQLSASILGCSPGDIEIVDYH